MTFDQLVIRIEAAFGEYTWPAAYTFDFRSQYADAPRDLREAGFEQGFEYSALNGANSCAWALAWLDARRSGDAAAEAEALAAMTDVLPNQPGVPSSPSTHQWLTEMAAKAALGDPTMVNQYVSANCAGIKWLPTT